jgi:hypothetical protein
MPHHDREMSLDSHVEKTLTSVVAKQFRSPKCIPAVPFFIFLFGDQNFSKCGKSLKAFHQIKDFF